MTITILTLTGAYALIAAILMLLLISTAVHPVIKAILVGLVAVLLIFTYRGIGDIRGLPSDAAPPQYFKLHWARVIEPNKLNDEDGSVFLWIEELDAENFPIGVPRAYELPYDEDLVAKVEAALGRIKAGDNIAGEVSDEETSDDLSNVEEVGEDAAAELAEVSPQNENSGQRVFDFDASNISFGESRAPQTPSKSP